MATQPASRPRPDIGDHARECARRFVDTSPPPPPELIARLRVIIHGSAAEPLNVDAA